VLIWIRASTPGAHSRTEENGFQLAEAKSTMPVHNTAKFSTLPPKHGMCLQSSPYLTGRQKLA
jgi:hypothetical protein